MNFTFKTNYNFFLIVNLKYICPFNFTIVFRGKISRSILSWTWSKAMNNVNDQKVNRFDIGFEKCSTKSKIKFICLFSGGCINWVFFYFICAAVKWSLLFFIYLSQMCIYTLRCLCLQIRVCVQNSVIWADGIYFNWIANTEKSNSHPLPQAGTSF